MAAIEVSDIKIYKGTDFEQDFQLSNENGSPINLVGCDVVSKIKKYPGSKTFNTFHVYYVNEATGLVRLSMSSSFTIFLTEGRNYFDVFVVYPNSKIKPVLKGTAIVEETSSSLIVPGKRIGDLGKVDTENIQDNEVLMYNQEEQQLEFVNPDEVLEKSAQDGLPEDFVKETKKELDNKFDIDLGEY